ncbi:hypothetical protein PIB30_081480 [Stylosanthes scabra]|uniref:Uncharacterized protein n=1 Tax=Stylosanthes scabra TaxID=79078 RepID=A0ABU6QU53_9FABA|nr:hypothetical protein [Stylosanthes scabra]
MPIYHDYHGDSKSSSISTWDQIQISLKYLLPSYQPIPSDSAVVASFLSDQPPKQIYADLEQNSVPEFQEKESEAEIDEGDAATIQNATKFPDLYQEAKWNSENSDQEIANTDQELTTDPTQFHQIQEITDPDFQFQIQTEIEPEHQKPESSSQFPEITTLEQAKSETAFQILNISSTNQEERNSANSDDQKQEDDDEDVLDARRI